ncbi:MAG: STAS-like domain-containing protein [Roseburia sp.]
MMALENQTKQIPVKEACITGEPIARSQAKRICRSLETYREVILDFSDVTMMGQGFADELFRVYVVAHPEVMLRPVNMLPQVERMIRHVGRGKSAENIIFPASK